MRHRFEQAGRVANAYNDGVVKTLVSIAREWVKVGLPLMEELKQIRKRLPAIRPEMTEKNKALLRHFDDPATLVRFYQVPQHMWLNLEGKAHSEISLAQAQAAIASAILFYAPLRVANLASLEIGVTLILPNHGSTLATIEIPARQTKNREPYRVTLPASVTEMIRAFDKEFLRPLGSRLVFDNAQGRPKRGTTVSWLIERTIRRFMGFKMTAHQFRHLAAKVILDEEPGAYPLLAQLLGHSSLKTAMRVYAELNTRRAARHHAVLLDRSIARNQAALAPRVRLRRKGSTKAAWKSRGVRDDPAKLDLTGAQGAPPQYTDASLPAPSGPAGGGPNEMEGGNPSGRPVR